MERTTGIFTGYPDPTPEDMERPEFDAVWNVIKKWDIRVDGGRMATTGNCVVAILIALDNLKKQNKCNEPGTM